MREDSSLIPTTFLRDEAVGTKEIVETEEAAWTGEVGRIEEAVWIEEAAWPSYRTGSFSY